MFKKIYFCIRILGVLNYEKITFDIASRIYIAYH